MNQNIDMRYQTVRIQTADRRERLLILYQTILGAMRRASRAYAEGAEMKAHSEVLRAQRGVVMLIGSLNMKAGGEFSRHLKRVYLYVNQLLIDTLRTSDARLLTRAISFIAYLYDAWREAFSKAKAA